MFRTIKYSWINIRFNCYTWVCTMLIRMADYTIRRRKVLVEQLEELREPA